MFNFRPPFTWFGRYSFALSTAVLLVVAAAFRFWRLDTLPPGLYTGEARVGLEALGLAGHGWLPSLTAANSYAPLWVWLEGLSVALFGHTALALRLWPALLGVAAVIMTWIWARDWFGPRIGWLAAFLLAITPWAVTLSRNAQPLALVIFLVPLTLWAATWAYHRQTAKRWIMLAAVLTLDLLAGPLGWLLVATVGVLGCVRLAQRRELWQLSRSRLAGLAGLGVGVLVAGYMAVISWPALSHLPTAAGFINQVSALFDGLLRTLLMFNLHGDENFRHNFAGEPLLNAFVGLMFVAGILVTISRLHERRYRVLLMLFVALLIPAWLSTVGVPNSAHAAAALPVVVVLAAVGISYMLELWYATFPINSAARSTGQAVIILLLALTLFQGYAQYFRAWGGSSEVYAAYNESAVAAAKFVQTGRFEGTRYAVAADSELPVVAYLAAGTTHTAITTAQVAGLPLGTGPKLFVITAAARDEAAKNLGLKFPGGKLKPHSSAFSQNELYYTYEVAK